MEELIAQQEVTFELIKKMGVNFKKAPKARLTKGYIQTRIETLNEYWEQFRTTHLEISKSMSAAERRASPYVTEDWFDAGEEEYLNTKADLQDCLESLHQPVVQRVSEKSHQEVKLPQINIPQFSGTYSDWSTFRDLYTSLIHENNNLSKVQKLHYLKTSVSGEAEQLLKHIPITESSYDSAWTTLISRYNNKRIIVNSILNKLLTQKKLTTESAKGVKELLDTTNECINNLKSNDVSTENWDILIIHFIVGKLDDESHKSWEEELGSTDINTLPSLSTFLQFLETRFRVLEMVRPGPAPKEKITNKPKTFAIGVKSTDTRTCGICGGSHATYLCEELKNIGVQERVQQVQKARLCFNCLSTKHNAKNCKSSQSCKQCHRRHHTLLHFPSTSLNTSSDITPLSTNTRGAEEQSNPTPSTSRENIETIRTHVVTQGQNALLATALINIQTGRGVQLVRALIDPCSQESFISEDTARRLQLKRKPVEGQVTGVDQMTAQIKYAIETQLQSRNNNFTIPCTAFVVKQVTDILPAKRVAHESWEHLKHLSLADPSFYQPGTIHMLLGVNIYTEILMSGVIRGEPGTPVAQQTEFGWIISGGVLKQPNEREIVSLHLNMSLNLDVMLQKFWETEHLQNEKNALTSDEVRAEEIYDTTVRRESDGRYVVALPFKRDLPILPTKSRDIALRRLKTLEKRLHENDKLREEYNAVMQEYLDLRHMELVNECELNERAVYLPHHAVVREDKETTKVRVVYNASQKGKNGVSLNDELLIGPSLQEELRDIILRWRTYKVGFAADIVKMYRQILVRREDIDFQRILWRFKPEDPVQEFRLLTVTFGTACAPYLAIKTLKQISKDENHDETIQRARDIVNQYFYVDDCLAGSYNEETAIEVQRQLTQLLKRGCFELQKWSSNSERFMNEIEPEKRTKDSEVKLNKRETVKTLGLTWNVKDDELQVTNKVNILEDEKITKRNVLSVIASLFDPMGFLAPTIIQAKIFMQQLWVLGISWDDELPDEKRQSWIEFRSQIPKLEEISINRWIGTDNDTKNIELHGFSDASTLAYAAVVYIRVITDDDRVIISLLKAKTKVAPLKQTTLPRLELCAAVLLSKLMSHVAKAMRISPENTYAWSDSKIALAWIKGDPSRWNTYVRNRVIEIDNNIHTTWSYVSTKENPADPASRGVAPETLKDNELWWNGPLFLQENILELPSCEVPDTDVEKREPKTCAATTVDVTTTERDDHVLTLMTRYSTLNKLLAVVAWVRRWLHLKENTKGIRDTLPAFVTQQERNEALTTCVKLTQRLEFLDEIEDLSNGKPLKKSSRLSSLTPFLDEKGVLRVGGRLKHADLEYLSKHPIILSKDNKLLPLILLEAHEKTLHGGPQMMLTFLRQRYWLLDAGNTLKKFARNCMRCARQRTITKTQLMGELPECRVKPSRPFSITGVDFAGPINTRMSKGRGNKSYKSYIAIFVCMVTKAIHIELVSDMTTEAFLAAYRRLIARRGICKEIWSDHGTTFVAAGKELLAMWKQGNACIPEELSALLDKEGTRWKYIPPGSPNFGGLWEAGVKSIKFHLKRIIGDSTLTFEELSTLLVQIEACLNSRPLSPISDDPRDLEPLTPSHFLVGEPLLAYPERDITDMNLHSLTRWQQIQKMTQMFWRKWQSEYLTRLQQRPKWRTPQKEFELGDLVLIKDSRCPPSKWMLGRIVAKHAGRDNLTRTYDVRTQSGVYTRTVTKLCPLPEV